MDTLANLLAFVSMALLAAYAGVVGFKILVGDINTSGLLDEKRLENKKRTGRFSPARLQSLVVTLGVSFYIVIEVTTTSKLPEISDELLLLIFGSHLGYLGFKGKRIFFGTEERE